MSSWDSSLAQKDDFFSFFGRGSGRGKGQIFSLLFFSLEGTIFGERVVNAKGVKGSTAIVERNWRGVGSLCFIDGMPAWIRPDI